MLTRIAHFSFTRTTQWSREAHNYQTMVSVFSPCGIKTEMIHGGPDCLWTIENLPFWYKITLHYNKKLTQGPFRYYFLTNWITFKLKQTNKTDETKLRDVATESTENIPSQSSMLHQSLAVDTTCYLFDQLYLAIPYLLIDFSSH